MSDDAYWRTRNASAAILRRLHEERRADAVATKRVKAAVTRLRRARDPQGPRRCSKGSDHWAAKLTEDDVRAIRRRHAAGEGRQLLSAEFKITPRMVNLIASRRRWQHVTD